MLCCFIFIAESWNAKQRLSIEIFNIGHLSIVKIRNCLRQCFTVNTVGLGSLRLCKTVG